MIGADIVAMLNTRLNDGRPENRKVRVRPVISELDRINYGIVSVLATVADSVSQWRGASGIYYGAIGVHITAIDYDAAEEIGVAVRGILHRFAGPLGTRYHVMDMRTDPETLSREVEHSVSMVVQGYSALWRELGA